MASYVAIEFETTRHSLPAGTPSSRANAAHTRNSKRQVPKPKETPTFNTQNVHGSVFEFGVWIVIWDLEVGIRSFRFAAAQRLLVSVPCKVLCEKSKPIPTSSFIASTAKLRWS